MFSPTYFISTCITALWKSGLNSFPTASIGFTPSSSSCCGMLLVDHFHSSANGIAFLLLCKTSFEVIHNRQHLFNDVSFAPIDVHAGFFFFRSFTVIIKFKIRRGGGSMCALQFCKFSTALFEFIFLFSFGNERSFC